MHNQIDQVYHLLTAMQMTPEENICDGLFDIGQHKAITTSPFHQPTNATFGEKPLATIAFELRCCVVKLCAQPLDKEVPFYRLQNWH